MLPNTKRERFTIVETSSERLLGFGVPSSESSETEAPLMFTGIQLLEPEIFDYIPRGVLSHSTTDVYPKALAKGERIAVHWRQDPGTNFQHCNATSTSASRFWRNGTWFYGRLRLHNFGSRGGRAVRSLGQRRGSFGCPG